MWCVDTRRTEPAVAHASDVSAPIPPPTSESIRTREARSAARYLSMYALSFRTTLSRPSVDRQMMSTVSSPAIVPATSGHSS